MTPEQGDTDYTGPEAAATNPVAPESGLAPAAPETETAEAKLARVLAENEALRGENDSLKELNHTLKVEKHRLEKDNRALRERLTTDTHTKLANFEGYTQWLQAELELDKTKEQSPDPAEPGLWVAFIDLDKFKSANDEYSHDVGDDLIVAMAANIRSQVRTERGEDIVAHPHGDEFVLGIQGVTRERVEQICQKILDLAQTYGVERRQDAQHTRGKIVSPEDEGEEEGKEEDEKPVQSFTMSIGLARYQPGMTMEDLIHGADMAMYRAKAEGGGTFHVSGDEHEAELPPQP